MKQESNGSERRESRMGAGFGAESMNLILEIFLIGSQVFDGAVANRARAITATAATAL
jgi:hypothetical protein